MVDVTSVKQDEQRIRASAAVQKAAHSGINSQSRPRQSGALTALVGVVYCAVACAVYWPVPPFDPSHIVACACGDAVQEAWFLKWVPFALGHGQNPLFSTYLNAPGGVNLGVNTSMPLLGFLGWPVTASSNSVAAYNFLLRLGLALSALSMHLVLRRYVRSRSAAFAGGLFFGFSPFMLAEGRVHLFLVFLPLLPPLIPLLDRWLIRADRNPYRCGALFGLLLGLEVLISAELAVVFVLLVAIALIPVAIRHHDLVRSRVPALVRGLAVSGAVGLLVGGYYAWMFVLGPQRPQGPPHSVANLDSYHADLLSLILPSRPQLLRPSLLHGTGDQFVRGSIIENGFYLGLPLLLVLVVGAVRLRRSNLVLSFATLGVISFVLGLGTQLVVANHVTSIPMPLGAVTGLPALQEIGPSQFALPIQLAAAVLLALVLDQSVRRFALIGIRRAAAVTALSLVALVPLLPSGVAPSVSMPPVSFIAGARKEIPAGATVLPYPYPYYSNNVAMLWQIASDMRFRMPGGEIYAPRPTGRSTNYPRGSLPPSLWAVLVQDGPQRTQHWVPPTPARRPGLVSALRTYVATHRIDTVVVSTTGTQARWVTALIRSALGTPTTTHDGIAFWSKLHSG